MIKRVVGTMLTMVISITVLASLITVVSNFNQQVIPSSASTCTNLRRDSCKSTAGCEWKVINSDCGSLSKNKCERRSGCSWADNSCLGSYVSDRSCVESDQSRDGDTDCSSLLENDCNSVPGCTWERSVLDCGLLARESCNNRDGCDWESASCSGDEVFCSSITNGATCTTSSCTWNSASCKGSYFSGGSCTGNPTCDPDDWSDWSACNAICGGGTQSHTNACGTTENRDCNTQACNPDVTPGPSSQSCKYCVNNHSNQAACNSRNTPCVTDINECETRNDCGYIEDNPICSENLLGNSSHQGSNNFICIKKDDVYEWLDHSEILNGHYDAELALSTTLEVRDFNEIVYACNQKCSVQESDIICNPTQLVEFKQCLINRGVNRNIVNEYSDRNGFRLQCGEYMFALLYETELTLVFPYIDSLAENQRNGTVSDYLSACNYSNGSCSKNINVGDKRFEVELMKVSMSSEDIPEPGDLLIATKNDGSCIPSDADFQCEQTGHMMMAQNSDACLGAGGVCISVFESNASLDEQITNPEEGLRRIFLGDETVNYVVLKIKQL